jgi:ABC-2 type transport system ATP-binding protein
MQICPDRSTMDRMIEAFGLTKTYGRTLAVDDLSFSVGPGRVTGFLGPNGAGKSTTMRMILGLDAPVSGRVLVEGRPYRSLREPLRVVGALLDARWVHPNRSARSHLLWLARSNRLPVSRVDEVLELVGLGGVAGRRAGGFSLGMSQRLGIAGALLGDPRVLLFDEPVNGLDPEGILWIRRFMQELASQGRTVFVSSHLLSEMALTAQDLVVIGRGRLIAQATTQEFIERAGSAGIRVRSPQLGKLSALLNQSGAVVRPVGGDGAESAEKAAAS